MRDMEYSALAEAIKNGRKRHSLSQDDLAKILGLTRVSISNMENGKQRPQWHSILRLCKISGIKKEIYKLIRNP